ncbi:EAL domain-containing protein [Aliivibrio sp. S3MY1]|uniref:EAL domain-containing protein n=1 Tax=unclassified Aliivibrio TaxID=2645654 RepID=UPI002379BFD4|nr:MULTISPECIES: EAL domain-containing protein [unclassified Aliivibrio]MDD9194978.1 EAL domain-containing protein [Aliivibrio sp. S3MY1]MDD9198274.1 EAL domain-containing protein [Aliivibrio sp. S2MY1]
MENVYFNYQPIIYQGSIKYYEALLRFYDKKINIEQYVKQVQCKPLFDIDVINHVLSDIQPMHCDNVISINISILSLEDDNFIQYARVLLKNKKIILEITEHDKCESLHVVSMNISLLKRETGIRFALDDCYKNNMKTLDLPIDIIKVDRAAIIDIENSDYKFNQLKKIINEVKTILKKEIIIEGVENEKQASLLFTLGDFNQQGYFYFKPLDIKHLVY